MIIFHTYTYTSLKVFHSARYVDNVKRAPKNIEDFLTPLAIWIIGDGARVGKSIKLCTNSFTYSDCQKLTQILYNLYNFKSSVQSAGAPEQYPIYIFAESIQELRSLVKPYIVSLMLYKLLIALLFS